MDHKRRNILFLCLLTFVKIWHLISSADISFTKYHFEPNFAEHRCGPTETAFEVDNVFDPVHCGWLCKIDNVCRSFFYQPDTSKCIGCRVNFGVKDCSYETYLGSKYFRTKPTYTSDTDCKDIFEKRCSAPSGLYEVSLWKTKEILTVYCDMDTDGGGWTVFQNRFDGSVNFTRNFSEYDNGFGNMNGEFWLGLKYIQELASQGSTDIRLEMTRSETMKYFQRYTNFKLLDGTDYKLSFDDGPADGTPGIIKSLNYNNGARFSTFDRDLTTESDGYCVNEYRNGWWYKKCVQVTLNGIYCSQEKFTHICLMFETYTPLKASRILIRRV